MAQLGKPASAFQDIYINQSGAIEIKHKPISTKIDKAYDVSTFTKTQASNFYQSYAGQSLPGVITDVKLDTDDTSFIEIIA